MRGGAGRGWGGAEKIESKKSKREGRVKQDGAKLPSLGPISLSLYRLLPKWFSTQPRSCIHKF